MTGSLSTAAPLTGTTAGVVALVTLGLALAARRAGLAHPRTLAASVAVGMTVWLAATAALAQSGFLGAWTSLPPRWPLLPLTALGTFVLLGQTPTFRRLLAEVPSWQPVALQTFRAGVELAFWRLHMEGIAPVQATFKGRNFDGLVGLTAPLVAAGLMLQWGHGDVAVEDGLKARESTGPKVWSPVANTRRDDPASPIPRWPNRRRK
jgi:hypothetical protein